MRLTAHGEVELVPVWSLHPYSLGSLQEGTLQATERETLSSTQLKTFHLKSVLPTRYAGAWWHLTFCSGKPMFGLI